MGAKGKNVKLEIRLIMAVGVLVVMLGGNVSHAGDDGSDECCKACLRKCFSGGFPDLACLEDCFQGCGTSVGCHTIPIYQHLKENSDQQWSRSPDTLGHVYIQVPSGPDPIHNPATYKLINPFDHNHREVPSSPDPIHNYKN